MIASNDKEKLSYYQHTLKDSFTCVSRGLHSGLKIVMRVAPAEANAGIVFVRRDVNEVHSEVFANWENVSDTRLCTTISNKSGIRVSSIEHLMAALYSNGIDNVRIILDGPEVPTMDGSAAPFVDLIKHVGKIKQDAERHAIIIKQSVSISQENKFAGLTPSHVPWMDIKIDFDSHVIGQQNYTALLHQDIFNEELSSARTFGFKKDIESLHNQGLAMGCSLQNSVVIDGDIVINEEGLRFDDEFVRHCMIDSVGDIALIGARLYGQFSGVCNGHQLNNDLIKKLMTDEKSWQYTTVRQAEKYWKELILAPNETALLSDETREKFESFFTI